MIASVATWAFGSRVSRSVGMFVEQQNRERWMAPSSQRQPLSHAGWGRIISEDNKAYTEREFALILAKASELARSSDGTERPSGGFSMEEMKVIAAEAGLDPSLVERAARLTPGDPTGSPLERLLGGPVKYRLGGHFATSLTDERAARLLDVVRAAAEQQGEGQASSSGISWHSVGEGSQILVSAHAEGGGTRVRIMVDRRAGLMITGTFSVLGSLALGVLVLVAGEALEFRLPLGLALMGGGMASVLALGRAVWTSTSRGIRKRVDALMDTVSRSLEEMGMDSTARAGGADRDGHETGMKSRTDGGAS